MPGYGSSRIRARSRVRFPKKARTDQMCTKCISCITEPQRLCPAGPAGDGAFTAQLLQGYRPGREFKEEPGQNRSSREHQALQGFDQQRHRLSEQNHAEDKRRRVALNLHHVWTKHIPSGPHLTDGYRAEEVHRTQGPASDAHRVPHYISTSVIISNER